MHIPAEYCAGFTRTIYSYVNFKIQTCQPGSLLKIRVTGQVPNFFGGLGAIFPGLPEGPFQLQAEATFRQVAQKQNWDLTEAQYVSIIADKSATFLSGCCRLGASLASASQDHVEALARYGMATGIAFQMTDDLLDIVGEESQTGKTTQSDLAACKPTLPLIHLLSCVDTSTKREICAMLRDTCVVDSRLKEMLLRHGSLDYVRRRAGEYVQTAIIALDPVPSTEARKSLEQTAHFLARRVA